MTFRTPDLLDAHPTLEACEAGLRHFGGRRRFHGPAATLRCFEDNSHVREWLKTPGQGRVLVIDGGGSRRCALVGDVLAAAALENGWAGIVLHGCVRDTVVLGTLDLGVMALDVQPRRSEKHGQGARDVDLEILGARVRPGDWVYADEDGVVFSQRPLFA
ncbi:MAG: ribonuclease E activity regulator RraA [Steroidobacteraceae bacterium]|jgi:regulator of ribonuclease activity A|nr:ribonuclease E activity regulator RraA [Steroidobacteraceae bacterium]